MSNGNGMKPAQNYSSAFVTAPDGLKLHVRCYGARHTAANPIICLPGLTRSSADFDTLAQALAADEKRPRRVLALDYRGRGRSGYDRNPDNYSVAMELADTLAVMTALDAIPAIFVGTSRGGILAMLLAALRPTAIAGAVLNDIGPVIETKGLMRIKSYVGKMPELKTLDEGAEILYRMFSTQFPALGVEQWIDFARRSFVERDGRLVADYDPNLSRTMANVDPEQPQPVLWNQFDALSGSPVMVIRGANSDILSAQTVAAMKKRRPDIEDVEVPGQGHAPMLDDEQTIGRIGSFIARCG